MKITHVTPTYDMKNSSNSRYFGRYSIHLSISGVADDWNTRKKICNKLERVLVKNFKFTPHATGLHALKFHNKKVPIHRLKLSEDSYYHTTKKMYCSFSFRVNGIFNNFDDESMLKHLGCITSDFINETLGCKFWRLIQHER